MTATLKKLILLSGDLLFLHLALLITILLRYPQDNLFHMFALHWPHFAVVFVIWVVVFYLNDLYDPNLNTRERKYYGLIFNAVLFSTLLSVIYFYLNVKANIAPKTNLVIFSAIFTLLFVGWRQLYFLFLASIIPQINIGLIGSKKHTGILNKELSSIPGVAYRVALVCNSAEEIDGLAQKIDEQKIRTLVICDDFGDNEQVRNTLFECLSYNLTFYNYPEFYERLTNKVPVESIGQGWFFDNLNEGRKNYYNFMKRGIDLTLALILFITTLALWFIIAFLIKATSRGPVFFTQVRMGKNEKRFRIIKFRTMRTDNNDESPTRENDDRMTGVGSFLRKTRLDEIPQVLNILKGDMSFIGPRPERPEIVAQLEHKIPFYKTRLLIKPGLTGWDQISGSYHSASAPDSLEKLQYDLFYLKHRSLYQDFSIALKTFATMIFHEGR